MTNWPWPMGGVQDWFENLWNHITDAVSSAVNGLWTKIWDKLKWVRDRLDESMDWVYDQLDSAISGVASALKDASTALLTSVENVVTLLTSSLTAARDWIVSQIVGWFDKVSKWITQSASWIWSQVQTGLNEMSKAVSVSLTSFSAGLTSTFSSGINWLETQLGEAGKDIRNHVTSGLTSWGEQIQSMLGGVASDISSWLQGTLTGIIEAFGKGMQGFLDWLLKHLKYFGEMVWGAVELLMTSLKDAATPVLTMITDAITGAMTIGTAPQNIQVAAKVVTETAWGRQIEMIDNMYGSEPTLAQLSAMSKELQAMLLVAGISASAAAIISELAHPFKNLGIRATTREIVYWAGIPSVTAAIATTPTAIGLLTPLRYALNKRWMPMKPPAADVIRFSVREVFLEERREALMAYYPGEEYAKLMAFQGYNDTMAEYYWMAHWVLPSISQLNEMLYRKVISYEEWTVWVRYNDVIPEMIPNLEKIIYNPYTRVDIRRMRDMRTVSIEEVLENYRWLGYDDEHAQGMTLWTEIYNEYPVLIAQYENGWITAADVLDRLIGLGMPEERAIELLKTRIEPKAPIRITRERDLTKSEIIKGVKTEILTPSQGIVLLQDLGYEEWEAEFILAIQGIVAEGDPEGYWEMKRVTEKFKKAVGKKPMEIPDEIIQLEKDIKRVKIELANLRAAGAPSPEIESRVSELGALEYRLRQLLITLKRTQEGLT